MLLQLLTSWAAEEWRQPLLAKCCEMGEKTVEKDGLRGGIVSRLTCPYKSGTQKPRVKHIQKISATKNVPASNFEIESPPLRV